MKIYRFSYFFDFMCDSSLNIITHSRQYGCHFRALYQKGEKKMEMKTAKTKDKKKSRITKKRNYCTWRLNVHSNAIHCCMFACWPSDLQLHAVRKVFSPSYSIPFLLSPSSGMFNFTRHIIFFSLYADEKKVLEKFSLKRNTHTNLYRPKIFGSFLSCVPRVCVCVW